MQSRQGMNKGMQGMRKKQCECLQNLWLPDHLQAIVIFLELLHQCWYACLCVYVPAFEAINN